MPAILSHASGYPPLKWNLNLKPLKLSTDQLWHEMTQAYELRMAARYLQASTTIKDTITNANLRTLSHEAMEHLGNKAFSKRKIGFEEEADISYVHLNMYQYEENKERIFMNRMQTISEDQELRPKSYQRLTKCGITSGTLINEKLQQ